MNNKRNIAFIILVLLAIVIPIFLNNFAANVEKFVTGSLIATNANIKTNSIDTITYQPGQAVLLFPTKTIQLITTSANAITTDKSGKSEINNTSIKSKPPNGAESFTLSSSRMDYLNTTSTQYQQPQPLSSQSQTTQQQSNQQTSGGSIGAMYNQAVNFFSPS